MNAISTVELRRYKKTLNECLNQGLTGGWITIQEIEDLNQLIKYFDVEEEVSETKEVKPTQPPNQITIFDVIAAETK